MSIYFGLMRSSFLTSSHCCVAPYSLSEALGLEATGMSILEVGLLSGFSVAQNANLQTNKVIKKVETLPGKVTLYLDSVSSTKTSCIFNTLCD